MTCSNQCDTCASRKVKPYPAVPADPPPIEYVPTWRDSLPDLAKAVLLVVGVSVASSVVTVLALGIK